MENDFSAIRSIQELKNLLDSGAITQQEFDALKRKIIFGQNQPDTSTGSTSVPVSGFPPFPETKQPVPVPGNPINPPYNNEAYVGYDNTPKTTPARNIDTIGPEGVNESGEFANTKKKDWLMTILISLGVLLLLVLIGFQLFQNQDSERLTSKSGPDAEEVIADTITATQEEQVTESTRADRIGTPADTVGAPATATTPNTEVAPIDANPATTTPTQPVVPTISNEEALTRIKDRLESYYDDMQATPFSAQRHFAPTVERYYTLINTTPAAITENITAYHFPEFQDSQSSIEDGSMKLVSNSADGYEVTYIEHGSALRKSKGQKQQTTARVRARFDQNFKMTYFRQEQLLENKFVE